tara:strand:+ start:33548 stop:33823 length:276 start_codon:yes stop_codon:yes gene_type:complete
MNYGECMSDNDVIVDEIKSEDAEPIVTGSNGIEDLIDAIGSEDFGTAETCFNDLVGSRLSDTLDQAKIKVADSIFNAQLDDEPAVEPEEEV